MKTIGAIVVVICTLGFAVFGSVLVAFSLNLFTVQNLAEFLTQTFQTQDFQLIIGGVGLFFILASLFIAQVTMGRLQREKTIAFNNPDGQVTVSLSAIEDFVKRLSSSMSEIRDMRSNVVAGKKGIEISVKVSLWADVNIPETTERIQVLIKERIQKMLGIEEPIVVRVHVGKIAQKETKRAKKKEREEVEEGGGPFRGSIEYGKE